MEKIVEVELEWKEFHFEVLLPLICDLLPFQTFEDLVCTVLDTLFSISERGHFWCPQTPKKTNKHLSLEGSLRLVLPRTSQTSRVITHQIP